MSLGGILAAVGLGLLLLVLVGPFLVPVPPLQGTVPPRALAGPDSLFLELEGIEVHYRVTGKGAPAFVLLHGFGASTFSWRELLGPLGSWGQAVAFDRPAFGLTARPLSWSGRNPYSPETQVALTIELMDALGLEHAVLLGHSAGGAVALQVALAHPERVQALILVSPAVGSERGVAPGLRWLLATPQARRLAPLLIRRVQDDFEDALRRAWHDPDKLTPEIVEGYRLPLRAENWDRALFELTLAARGANLEDLVGEVRVPVLAITGDDDRLVPSARTAALVERFADAELLIVPDCGHVAHEECPAPVVEAIEGFLRRHGLL